MKSPGEGRGGVGGSVRVERNIDKKTRRKKTGRENRRVNRRGLKAVQNIQHAVSTQYFCRKRKKKVVME